MTRSASISAISVGASASARAGPPISKRVYRASEALTKTCKLGIARRRKSIYSDYKGGDYLFPGFPPEAITFLRGLARNNDREWFQPRKEIFESKVKAPMVALVECLNEELAKFAPDYITEP